MVIFVALQAAMLVGSAVASPPALCPRRSQVQSKRESVRWTNETHRMVDDIHGIQFIFTQTSKVRLRIHTRRCMYDARTLA